MCVQGTYTSMRRIIFLGYDFTDKIVGPLRTKNVLVGKVGHSSRAGSKEN
ncbi:predicted protein [Sclerotinia sclerotiorum 1980 UF-70]|uniref:Uncharacterized protein n=1 Tax=Sclerotinia sclerotiorum (strain ATCC 18683 / 1980 / Ss-1) TaxID=665079 RepID=A7F9N4_SCLS1|nr:predicted protein [Sclerotinia sclerotiorum 1980 UF-70]EDO00445.1 predicted protein [Sclerotinia sclerotiorum 1980 UF-70]